MWMLPVFLINLERSADRLARMTAEFQRVGVGFERFPAVNGTDLPAGHASYFCDASGRIASPLSPGEIGCYASHLGIWQRIVDGEPPAALICEDDIILPTDLAALLEATAGALPAGWDIVRLVDMDNWGRKRALALAPLPGNRHIIRYWRAPMRAGAYIISRAGAKKLLRPGLRCYGVDADLRRPWLFALDHYGVHPAPIIQHADESLIGADRGCAFARRQWKLSRKLRRAPLMVRQQAYNLKKMGLWPWSRLLFQL
jgi:glycosyl transferase family 25